MLVHAQSVDHAYKIARKKIKEVEIPYQNKYGQQVTWKLLFRKLTVGIYSKM